MRVQELIEELDNCDPQATVYLEVVSGAYYTDQEVKSIIVDDFYGSVKLLTKLISE